MVAPAYSRADAQDSTLLAVVEGGGGHLLQVVVRRGQVVPRSVSTADLPPISSTRGLTFSGAQVRVTLDSLNRSYEPPDFELYVRLESAVRDPGAALFDSLRVMQDSMMIAGSSRDTTWARRFFERYGALNSRALAAHSATGRSTAILTAFGPDQPQFIEGRPTPIDSTLAAVLRTKADSLWSAALLDLPADRRSRLLSLGLREVLSTAEYPEILHIWIQGIANGRDPRGSFYFVYDRRESRFTHASFGHPEWSPNSELVQTRPRMFFRLPRDQRTFVLAEYGVAWEDYSSGWAILDASSGRMIALSN